MEPTKLPVNLGAPVIFGATTPRAHLDSLLKGYRAHRLATYHANLGMPLAEAEQLAERDTANLRARETAKLDAALAGAARARPAS